MRMHMNSKFVKKGDYFLVNRENEEYVNDAIKKGASKIITELNTIYDVETIMVENVKAYLHKSYFDKIGKMKFVGVTGTNGKTTTCYLMHQMAKLLNIKSAYIGTIGFYLEDDIIPLDNTTPSMDVLYNMLLDSYEKGVKIIFMEVSSHALKQERTYGLLFDAIAITNVTRDHLDYHKSMKDYINSKKKLVGMTRGKKICVLNGNDRHYKKFLSKENKNIIIGKKIKIKKIVMLTNGTKIIAKEKNKFSINLDLVGLFNIYNFLMAYEIMKSLGYDGDLILKKSNTFVEPPGRMQKVFYKKNVIFIDYAHTPDAVENVLKTVKKIKNKGIITIMGCGGDRDKDKRPIMANIACKNSDKVIFTNDNPRSEDEKKIMKDILIGAVKSYEVIYDRFDAIKRGIEQLGDGMILMILGKGHENYQIIGKEKLYFSDFEEVNNIILKKSN